MSTQSTLFCADAKGVTCHIYWELAERIPGKAAPIYMSLEKEGKEIVLRLPKELANEIRMLLNPDGWDPL